MDTPTLNLPKIGPKTIAKLHKLSIFSSSDLIHHFPSRYIDFTHISPISALSPHQSATITARVDDFTSVFTRSGKNFQKATVSDKSGRLLLIWFNQPYLRSQIQIGETISFAGTVDFFSGKLAMLSPVFGPYNTGKIIAVYPETKGLTSNWFRKTIQSNLNTLIADITDPLPSSVLTRFRLLDLPAALSEVHQPTGAKTLNQARLRLAVDEIISLQAESILRKEQWLQHRPRQTITSTPKIGSKLAKFIGSLPYRLTPSQLSAWKDIKNDLLSSQKVANRLLQGDVGSGKTIVALLACYFASLNRQNSLLIAPTAILALQHYQNFRRLLPTSPPLILITGNSQKITRIPRNAIIIGTHAAIYRKKQLPDNIFLLVVDEQHKFGVNQRSFLSSGQSPPHCLTMTATPIPRTISLTWLGNLDLSTLKTIPDQRPPIKTFLVPNSKKPNCYHWLSEHIHQTHQQAFIVCPLIDTSETLENVKAASSEFDYLSSQIFPDLRLSLIHGRMDPPHKEKIITDFQKGLIDILVTTPIIEVGIDIPNATVIIIQSAERFGLSSLHQIRGRVGRCRLQGYCYLFTESDNPRVTDRLNFVTSHRNGLAIAEYDLKIRGPGKAFSTLQHGFPSLKLAKLDNLKLISHCQNILKNLVADFPGFNLSRLTPHSSSTSITN